MSLTKWRWPDLVPPHSPPLTPYARHLRALSVIATVEAGMLAEDEAKAKVSCSESAQAAQTMQLCLKALPERACTTACYTAENASEEEEKGSSGRWPQGRRSVVRLGSYRCPR